MMHKLDLRERCPALYSIGALKLTMCSVRVGITLTGLCDVEPYACYCITLCKNRGIHAFTLSGECTVLFC